MKAEKAEKAEPDFAAETSWLPAEPLPEGATPRCNKPVSAAALSRKKPAPACELGIHAPTQIGFEFALAAPLAGVAASRSKPVSSVGALSRKILVLAKLLPEGATPQ